MTSYDWTALVDAFLAAIDGQSSLRAEEAYNISDSTILRWRRAREHEPPKEIAPPRGRVREELLRFAARHNRPERAAGGGEAEKASLEALCRAIEHEAEAAKIRAEEIRQLRRVLEGPTLPGEELPSRCRG